VTGQPQSCDERWGEEIAAYSLDALDENAAARVTDHVAGCEACAARLRWLQAAVDLLPASVPQHEAPPALRRRLMATVEAESGTAAPSRSAADQRPSLRERFAARLGGLGLRPALAGLAVALLVAGVVGYELRGGADGNGDGHTVAATALKPYSGASGSLVINGDRGDLHVSGMPALKGGQVYQAWVATGNEIEPSSVFVLASDGTGEVSIPDGLSGADQVMVTREPAGGSTEPSTGPMLSATVD